VAARDNLSLGVLPLTAWIQVAGAVQIAIALANVPLALRLEYGKNLLGASSMVRRIFYVHAAYVVYMVLGLAAISLAFPAELASGRGIGWFLSGFMAVFWGLRVPIQLFYYPVEVRKQNRLADVVFIVAFAFLAAVFAIAALR
jgi:hypothetical protein